MIRCGRDPFSYQGLSYLSCAFPAPHINYGRSRSTGKYVQRLIYLQIRRTHYITYVVAGKARFHHSGIRAEIEFPAYVVHHFRCGRGGQRHDRSFRSYLPKLSNAEIRRAEIIAPLRDAMRFVNHNQTNRQMTELLKEPVIPEAFRGKIQKTASIVGKAFPSHTDFTGRHRRMKEHCLDTPGTQVVHLILHKRNQRRNHNSKAAKDKPRHLKRNGFSASGRHKAKGVVAVKHRPHNLLLKRAERPESPMTAQDFLCPFHLFSESLMSRIINCTESGFPARLVCSMV